MAKKTTKNNPIDPYGAEARYEDATRLQAYAAMMRKAADEHMTAAEKELAAASEAITNARKLLRGDNDPDLIAYVFAFKEALHL